MIYEYAVDPEVMSSVDVCTKIFENFGSEKARVISNIPSGSRSTLSDNLYGWSNKASQAINKIPHEDCRPRRRKALKNELLKLVNKNGGLCSRPLDEGWDNIHEWLEYVSKADADYHFEAVITTNESCGPIQTYDIRTVLLDDPTIWKKDTQKQIERKADIMINEAMPMLRISTEITLVDKFINPNEKRYKNVLAEIINRSNKFNFGRGIRKIVIYYSDRDLLMQSALERNFSVLPPDFTIECHEFPRKFEHDRLLITNIGSMFYSVGLDEYDGRGSRNTRVILLKTNMYRRVLSDLRRHATRTASICGKN